MKQAFFLILVYFYAMCATVSADEKYLLRIDVVGYIKSIEDHPQEKVMRSIEVVSRPNETFHCKIQNGGYTEMLTGKLIQEDDEFKVRMHYLQTFDDGTRVLGKPVLQRSEVQSVIGVAVGESAIVGRFETGGESIFVSQTKEKDKKNFIPYLSKVIDGLGIKKESGTVLLSKTKTRKKVILLLSKYEPVTE